MLLLAEEMQFARGTNYGKTVLRVENVALARMVSPRGPVSCFLIKCSGGISRGEFIFNVCTNFSLIISLC
jgi:hypothetical protein